MQETVESLQFLQLVLDLDDTLVLRLALRQDALEVQGRGATTVRLTLQLVVQQRSGPLCRHLRLRLQVQLHDLRVLAQVAALMSCLVILNNRPCLVARALTMFEGHVESPLFDRCQARLILRHRARRPGLPSPARLLLVRRRLLAIEECRPIAALTRRKELCRLLVASAGLEVATVRRRSCEQTQLLILH